MTPRRHRMTRTTRRSVLKGSLATGAGLAIAGSGRRGFQVVGAQTPGAFDREASITSWGFGVEETNPLAFARVEAFREAYPNIEIELVGELDDQKILTAAASNTLPDLMWLGRIDIASWAARDVVTPLEDCIQQGAINPTDFYDAAINEASYNNEIYGIPGGMDVRALYVNLDHLEEIGVDGTQLDTSDWDMLAELGAQLVKRSGDQIERWGFDTKMQAGWLWLWGLGNGGTFIAEDGTEITYDDPQVVEALEWGINAYEMQGGFQDYEAVATTWQGDEQFARGQVSMSMYESWMLGILARVNPDLNFAMLPIRERGSGPNGPMVSFTGGFAWTIPQGADDPEAACEFISFMHTLDTWMIGARARKEQAQAEGKPFIPALTAHREADRKQIEELYEPISPNVDAAVRLFPDLLEESVNRPIAASPASAELEDILFEVGIMPALRGERPAEESLAEADEQAQEAVEEFT